MLRSSSKDVEDLGAERQHAIVAANSEVQQQLANLLKIEPLNFNRELAAFKNCRFLEVSSNLLLKHQVPSPFNMVGEQESLSSVESNPIPHGR